MCFFIRCEASYGLAFLLLPVVKQARYVAEVAIRSWPDPKSGGDNNLLSNFVLLLSVKVPVFPQDGRLNCLHFRRKRVDGTGLFHV